MSFKLNAIFIRRILWIGTFVLASFGAEYASGADRYWVGDGGNWSDAANHWATNSGGTGSVDCLPTSSDNVYFDASSFISASQTVRVDVAANCADMAWTNVANIPTFAGSSNLNVYGSLTFVSGMTQTYSGTITFRATDTGKTFTAGRTLACNITFDGVGGGWTLQDDLKIGSKSLTLTRGSLDLNGKTNTCGTFDLKDSAGRTRTLICGASTINCTSWDAMWFSGLTLIAGTSTIKSGPTFNGGEKTYYVVELTGSAGINQANTYTNLTITGNGVNLRASQTIAGTLTLAGPSATSRMFINTLTRGVPYTLTAGTVVVSNADFQDITGAPAGNWDISACTGGSGDYGGNSNIIFTTAQDHYWVATNGGNWSATSSWSTNSGGLSGARVLLPQDNAFIDANSIVSGSRTIRVDTATIGKNIDFTGVLNSPTVSLANDVNIYGSLNLTTNIGTFAHNNKSCCFYCISSGIRSNTLTSAGKTLYSVQMYGVGGGTLTLQDNLTCSSSLTLTYGTLDFNGQDVSTPSFNLSGSTTRGLKLGSGTITLTGTNGTIWSCGTSSGLTFDSGSSTVKVSAAATTGTVTFSGGGKTYNDFQWTSTMTGTGTLQIAGANTFNNFTVKDGPKTIIWPKNTTNTFNGTFSAIGTQTNCLVTFTNSAAGNFYLSKTNGIVSCHYLSLSDSHAQGGATWLAGYDSINAGTNNNTGWIFKALRGTVIIIE